MNWVPLVRFIAERHRIYEARQNGEPKPWTRDKIFQQYRFCNVYRELDKVTVWIRENWRKPNYTDPELWFAMAVARLLNLPASLAVIGYPVPWNKERFKKLLREYKEAGNTVFNGAYMIHADAEEGWLKTDYLAERVINPMWEARKTIQLKSGKVTLEGLHRDLMTFRDMGSFMSGQVVADTKFSYYMTSAPDWWTWAAIGPGSARGLNRVLGNQIKEPWKQDSWLVSLRNLGKKIEKEIAARDMMPLSMQDLQNCLCEYDKYQRVYLGQGKPKQKYKGGA